MNRKLKNLLGGLGLGLSPGYIEIGPICCLWLWWNFADGCQDGSCNVSSANKLPMDPCPMPNCVAGCAVTSSNIGG